MAIKEKLHCTMKKDQKSESNWGGLSKKWLNYDGLNGIVL